MANRPAYKPWKDDADYDLWVANLITPVSLAESIVARAKVNGARIKRGSHTEWAIKNAIVNEILDSRSVSPLPEPPAQENADEAE